MRHLIAFFIMAGLFALGCGGASTTKPTKVEPTKPATTKDKDTPAAKDKDMPAKDKDVAPPPIIKDKDKDTPKDKDVTPPPVIKDKDKDAKAKDKDAPATKDKDAKEKDKK